MRIWLVFLISVLVCEASDIDGTVVIKRKLTKSKVTAPAGSYQRGVAVELKEESRADIINAELQRVVIYLEGELPAREVLTATMEQKNRQFLPDTLVIPVGSRVSFPNLDPIFHNVFSLSKAASFDLGNYVKDQTRVVTFRKPGVVFLNCHLHPNMAAAIVVTPNGWTARLDDRGRFRMPSVPPGQYTVVAWHKSAGFFRQTLRITGKGNAEVSFLIPLEEPTKPVVASR